MTWRTRRRIAAAAQGAVLLSLPYLRIGGESALRFDIPGMKLYAFGAVLWISEFHIVLAATLLFLAFILAVTVVFGRIWCGWICPQTVLPELSAAVASPLPHRVRRAGGRLILLLLSGLVSFSLIAYFVPPADAARDLFRSGIVTGFFLGQWAVIFLMAGVLGPRFCRTVCPYSMLQNILYDGETLSISFDASRAASCLKCGLCEAVCPVEIDIRKGAQRECIACAECIDACRTTTAPRGVVPFVGYRGRVLRPKAAFLGIVLAAGILGVLFLVERLPPATFAVQWEAGAPDRSANSYRYTVQNNLGRPLILALRLVGEGEMSGDGVIRVAPRSRATGKLVVRRKAEAPGGVSFVAAAPGITLKGEAGYP